MKEDKHDNTLKQSSYQKIFTFSCSNSTDRLYCKTILQNRQQGEHYMESYLICLSRLSTAGIRKETLLMVVCQKAPRLLEETKHLPPVICSSDCFSLLLVVDSNSLLYEYFDHNSNISMASLVALGGATVRRSLHRRA